MLQPTTLLVCMSISAARSEPGPWAPVGPQKPEANQTFAGPDVGQVGRAIPGSVRSPLKFLRNLFGAIG